MEPILELRGVSKEYSGQAVLDGVSLSVPPGSFFALLGPSGCGKTTTLRLTAGFESPTAGEIFLHGKPMNGRRPYERKVSTVFQNFALFPHLTVRQNIEFGLRHQKIPDRDKRIAQALELVQLRGKESHYPAQISGGEKQRTALARSLVLEPDVLLLDEPLSSLDPGLRKMLRNELKALQRRVGIAFLMVTHDQEEALSVSDQIAVMHKGRIRQVGSPETIYLRPNSRFVADFVGTVNWIDGAGVRPEATRVSRQPVREGRVPSRQATVVQVLFLGGNVEIHARLEDGAMVTASLRRQQNGFQPGDTVIVSWDPGDALQLPEEPS
jgi:ABC-type Fe3+/spermidine/putrescine transport system ATPase subunit